VHMFRELVFVGLWVKFSRVFSCSGSILEWSNGGYSLVVALAIFLARALSEFTDASASAFQVGYWKCISQRRTEPLSNQYQ